MMSRKRREEVNIRLRRKRHGELPRSHATRLILVERPQPLEEQERSIGPAQDDDNDEEEAEEHTADPKEDSHKLQE